MSNDWFDELTTAKYLDIGSGRVLGYRLENLCSGMSLVKPATVYAFSQAVIKRSDNDEHIKIYDVRTKRLEEDNYELVGKLYYSTKIVRFNGTADEVAENFLVVKNSAQEVQGMLRQRANWSKSNPRVTASYVRSK